MAKRGIITVVVMILLATLTPAGLFVFVTPIIVWCIWWKKIWQFYLRVFFGDDK